MHDKHKYVFVKGVLLTWKLVLDVVHQQQHTHSHTQMSTDKVRYIEIYRDTHSHIKPVQGTIHSIFPMQVERQRQ